MKIRRAENLKESVNEEIIENVISPQPRLSHPTGAAHLTHEHATGSPEPSTEGTAAGRLARRRRSRSACSALSCAASSSSCAANLRAANRSCTVNR